MRNYSATATATSTTYNWQTGYSTATETFTLEAKSSVATIGIGNHWLLDWGLWIGGDWVLASGAISESSEATLTNSSGTITAAESAKFKKDAEALGDLVQRNFFLKRICPIYHWICLLKHFKLSQAIDTL